MIIMFYDVSTSSGPSTHSLLSMTVLCCQWKHLKWENIF